MKHKRDTQEFQILLGQHNLPNRPNKTFWKQITIDNAIQALAIGGFMESSLSKPHLPCYIRVLVGTSSSMGWISCQEWGSWTNINTPYWMWQFVGYVSKKGLCPQFIAFLKNMFFFIGNMMNQGWQYLIPWQTPNQQRRLSGFNPGISSAKQMLNRIIQILDFHQQMRVKSNTWWDLHFANTGIHQKRRHGDVAS